VRVVLDTDVLLSAAFFTGDKELLNLGLFPAITILSPRTFSDRLRVD
jgi:predicted nucleic acid-binding protein